MMQTSESSTGRSVKVRGFALLLMAACLLVFTGPGLAMVNGAGLEASTVAPEAIEHSLKAQRYDADATIDQRVVHAHGDDIRGAYDAAGHLLNSVAVACPGRQSFQTPRTWCAAAKGGAKYGATPKGRPLTKHYGTGTGPKRNIPGSVVDNTIDTTPGVPGKNGTTVHYDPANNVTVVTGEGGSIVSAHKGKP